MSVAPRGRSQVERPKLTNDLDTTRPARVGGGSFVARWGSVADADLVDVVAPGRGEPPRRPGRGWSSPPHRASAGPRRSAAGPAPVPAWRPRWGRRTRRCGRGGWCGPARRRRAWPPTGCGWRRAGTSPPHTACCSAAGGPTPAGHWVTSLHGLADTSPSRRPASTCSSMGEGDASDPVAPDGHLRPEWVSDGWSDSPERVARWAAMALTVAGQQQAALAGLNDRPMAVATARCESTAELLCAELSVDGLPMDRTVAEQVLAGFIGPRPHSGSRSHGPAGGPRRGGAAARGQAGVTTDLRSPAQVRSLLARVGVDVPDTRASRLRDMRDAHPLVGALLEWRKAERIATTYRLRRGWTPISAPIAGLRGEWTGSDGAAGRTNRVPARSPQHRRPRCARPSWRPTGTYSSGPTWAQIEPRVLAAVSGIDTRAGGGGPVRRPAAARRWRRSSAWIGRSPR